MEQYIPKSDLVAEIDRRKKAIVDDNGNLGFKDCQKAFNEINEMKKFIDTLEAKEVDLDKLGEIARHLIAVKEHIEDMRLDKEEWLILEKIGYPERFKAQKEE